MMKRKTQGLSLGTPLLTLSAAFLVAAAQGAQIGINFQDDWGTGGGAAVTGDAYGVPAASWHNMDRVRESYANPVSTNKTITLPDGSPLKVTWSCRNTWSLTADIPTLGDDQVIYGYLDDSDYGYTVTLTGFRGFASGYTVTTIASTDGGIGFADALVTYKDGTHTLQYLNNFNPSYAGGLAGVSTVSPVINTVDGNHTIVIKGGPKSGETRSTLAAIIIDYTPGTTQPVIETDPQTPAATVFTGQSFTLTALASGTAPLGYQWRKDGVIIPGATGTAFTKNNSSAADNGDYDVVVTNPYGNATSKPATINVSPLTQPAITRAPVSQSPYVGYPVTFTAEATGGQLSYQWKKGGTVIPGATTTLLTLANVAQADAGTYEFTAANPVGNASATATLTVKVPQPGSFEEAASWKKPAIWYRMSDTAATVQFPATNSGTLGASGNGVYIGPNTRPVIGALAGTTDSAVQFMGGKVTVPYHASLNPAGPFTVEAWIKPANVNDGSRIVVQSMINGETPENPNDRSGWAFRQNGAKLEFLVGGTTGAPFYTTIATTPNVLTAGVWQHVAAVYIPATLTVQIFVNGTLALTTAAAEALIPNPAAPLIVGDRGYGGWAFNGAIDEVALYPSALTSVQLLAHYQNGTDANRLVAYPTLVATDGAFEYLRLNEPSPYAQPANVGTFGAAFNGAYMDAGGVIGAPRIALGQPGPRPSAFPGFEPDNRAVTILTNAFVAAPPLGITNNSVTVLCWINRQDPSTSSDLSWPAWIGNGGMHMNPDGELRYHWNGGQWGWSSGLRVPANEWTLAAMVVNPTNATFYMSSGSSLLSAVNTANHTPMEFSTPMGFGGNQPGRADRTFIGQLDETMIFDRALSADEISLLFVRAKGIPLKLELVPGGIIEDTKPQGTPHHGYNRGSTWQASNTDPAITPRTRTGVEQFSAAVGSQVVVPAHPDFNSTVGTITFWMRANAPIPDPGNEGAIIFDRRELNGAGGDVIVLKDDGTIFVQAEAPPGRTGANSFSVGYLPDDTWHHVAYVYDQSAGGSTTLYIDGFLAGSNPNTVAWSWPANRPLEIGRSHDGYWKRFDGFLDDFRIYNRALTDTEIAQVFNSGALVDPAALKLRFDFGNSGIGKSLVWPFGTLESSPTLGPSADWQPVPGASSPYPFLPTDSGRFFRIRM